MSDACPETTVAGMFFGTTFFQRRSLKENWEPADGDLQVGLQAALGPLGRGPGAPTRFFSPSDFF